MNERTWDGVYHRHGKRPSKSSVPSHASQSHVPDPNNERDKAAIRYWIKFADFYQMPYITYYDSVRDLADKLSKTTLLQLRQISARMKEYNANVLKEVMPKWKQILINIAKSSVNAPH